MATPTRELDVHKATTPSLFAAVLDDARELAIGHLERMQRETSNELATLKRAIAKTAVAVGIVIVGAVLGGHTIAQALIAGGLPSWAGYLIAAALAVGGGLILLATLPKDHKQMDLVPEESIAGLRRDVAQVKEAAKDVVRSS